MSKFSSALQIIDLDDFVSPSQECIKPVKLEKDDKKVKEIKFDINGNMMQVNFDGTSNKLEKSKISLSDCLACSGCITSAESILVNEQSTDEFLKNVTNPQHKVFIVSISPQARSSLAVHWGSDLKTVRLDHSF
jgi:iron only hydrogenase large subunit-like protein